MKKYVLLIFPLFFVQLCMAQPGQKKKDPPQKNTWRQITETDIATAKIKRNLETYIKTTTSRKTDVDGYSNREVFKKAGDVQLIALNQYSKKSGEQKRVEYYYSAGQLIYVEYIKAGADNKISIERFYVNNGRLLVWFNNRDESVLPSSNDYKNVDDTLNTASDKLKKEALN